MQMSWKMRHTQRSRVSDEVLEGMHALPQRNITLSAGNLQNAPERPVPSLQKQPHSPAALAQETRHDYSHGEAPRALDVHEKRVGRLYQPLQLVLLRLDRGVGVQQVTLQSLHKSCP